MYTLKINKKAQNVGQIFTYILSIVIVGVILLFGYNAIKQLWEKQDTVAKVDFEKKLEAAIISTSSEYGAVRKKTFDVGSSYKSICFAKNYGGYLTTASPIIYNDYPEIKTSVQSGVKKNIFYVRTDGSSFALPKEMGKIAFEDANNPLECIPVKNSRLTINIEGMGDYAIIKPG
jgi:hypothetical protein